MKDRSKTKAQLISELAELRGRIKKLEAAEAQLRLAEENLRRRTSELQSIFRAFPDLYFRLAPDGTILDYNAGHESYLYVPPEIFLGKRMQDVLPPNVGRLFFEAVPQVLKTKSLVSIEYSLRMPSGEQSFEARLLPLVENQVMVLVRNMTDRKKAEEALREGERRYRTLFEESRDSIYISTREGRFLDANQTALDLLGYTKEELTGTGIREIYVDASDRARFQEEIEQKGSVRDYEIQFRRKDGAVMDCLLTATVRRAEDGTILGYQGIIHDITQRKRAEEEIKKLNQDLKRRTVELETANKELEAFSYSVSHDLRAPLVAIGGFSRLIIERCGNQLDGKGRHFLEVIYSNTEKMLQLIDDLIAFSHLEHQELKTAEIDMADLARAVFEELKPLHPGRPLSLDLKTLRAARGDLAMVRQVFINLLSNAIKFTRPKETGLIEIGCTVNEAENIYYVKDNGVGFDMQQADKLFSVFQRLHNPETFEGTGIGLAIVQRIVHRHGGWVWAEGRVNEGATFYFALPGDTGA